MRSEASARSHSKVITATSHSRNGILILTVPQNLPSNLSPIVSRHPVYQRENLSVKQLPSSWRKNRSARSWMKELSMASDPAIAGGEFSPTSWIMDDSGTKSSHCSKPAVGYVQRNIGYHRPSFEGDPIGSWHALPAAPQLSLLRRPPSTRPGFLPDRGAFTTPNEAFRFCTHVRAYCERARLGDILLARIACEHRSILSREDRASGRNYS